MPLGGDIPFVNPTLSIGGEINTQLFTYLYSGFLQPPIEKTRAAEGNSSNESDTLFVEICAAVLWQETAMLCFEVGNNFLEILCPGKKTTTWSDFELR